MAGKVSELEPLSHCPSPPACPPPSSLLLPPWFTADCTQNLLQQVMSEVSYQLVEKHLLLHVLNLDFISFI